MLRADSFNRTKLTPLDQAYLDALSLLNQPGACSEFFGGHAAERALEEFTIQLSEERINNPSLGIRMSGPFTQFTNAETGATYRLFANAELNTEGPFYKAKIFPSEPQVPNVGAFGPNTRPARVLILLHELGHLIQGKDGRWLIPDDGGNPELSRQNTSTLESRCRTQIRKL
jgi:hypothetical protein